VSATGTASCGWVRLGVAVCAGADHEPPCLNTLADEPYYIDRNGTAWSVFALSGTAATGSFPSVVEGDFVLQLRDGDATRELPSHVRVCADLVETLQPCK
jgi:hypothetical protein